MLLVLNHEYWRDEVRSWHLASESLTFLDLIKITKVNEGSPSLWYIILYLISHYITKNFFVMKLFHILISTTTSFLILKFSPFNKRIKILLIFSYFFFYEYSIISRNYALGLLLIIILLILYKNIRKNLLLISITILLLGQVNTLAFIISIGFFLLIFSKSIYFLRYHNLKKIFFSLYIFIFFLSILIFLWQLLPQESTKVINYSTILNIFFKKSTYEVISSNIISSFFQAPVFTLNFWNSNILVNLLSNTNIWLRLILSLFIFSVPLFFLKKKATYLYLFTGLIYLIGFSIYLNNSARHFGHLFILLIACIWISNIEKNDTYFIKNICNKKIQYFVLYIILSVSIFGSITAFYFDYKYPFSNGKYVAEYIEKNFDKNSLAIVGYLDYATETIAGYLEKDFYYPNSRDFKKLVDWGKRSSSVSISGIFDEAKFFANNGKKVLVILNGNITQKEPPEDYLLLDMKLDNSIVADESYKLFALKDNFNFNIIKTIEITNIEENFFNISNCSIKLFNDDKIFIESFNEDPFFEINYKFPADLKNKTLYINIGIETFASCDLDIYYKRKNKSFNSNDFSTKKIQNGYNNIFFKIDNSEELENIRLDPVNIRTNAIIDKIIIYGVSR